MIIDLHTHTYPSSDDSSLSPDRLVEAAKGAGLNALCITDHDRFWAESDVSELSKRHDFLVIRGCEITTEEGHLLVYGLSQYVYGMHRTSFVKRLVDQAGGAIVVAHPYRRAYRQEQAVDPEAYSDMLEHACRNSVFQVADAVDVLNGRGSAGENAFAADLAGRLRLKGTGASDAHDVGDLGTFATEFHRPVEGLADLVRELKAGRFEPVVLNGKQPRVATTAT